MSGSVVVERFCSKGLRWAVLLAVGLVVVMGFAARPAVASAADTWTLAADMQANALSGTPLNPFPDAYGHAGVWELMVAPSTTRDPASYYDMVLDVNDPCSIPGIVGWHNGVATPVGIASVNTTNNTIHGTCGPYEIFPPHEAFLHPGPANDSLVAWHSPITGTVSVSGGVSDADCGGGNGIAWFIDQGSNDLASGSIANCGAQRFPANLTVTVTKGATLYFLIDPKNNNYSYDLTQTDVTITELGPPPSIGLVAPASGVTGGQVTIIGTNLGDTTGVKFGSLPASFTIVSTTEVRATVPDGAIAAKISVTTPTGAANSPQLFTPTLSITSFSTHSGPAGTVLDIRGIGFAPGSSVKFNGTASSGVTYINPGEVKATVPATATSGPIALSDALGTARAGGTYTVTPSVAPTISSFTPASTITGTKVMITGTYLSGASSIKFGSLAASNFTIYSPTQLAVRVPDGAIAAPISVITAAGSATSTDSFTPTLSITGFTPASGPAGTIVDITGIGFTPTSSVKFNGTNATTTYIGPSEVKATVPTGASTGPIWLTTTDGTVQARTKYTLTTTKTTPGTRPIATRVHPAVSTS